MQSDYDHIIVGAGPTGLALAQVLSISSRVLLLEKRDFLGGCHGVTRVHDGMMTEHGPRIYIDNFLMFTQLLNDMGVQFAVTALVAVIALKQFRKSKSISKSN